MTRLNVKKITADGGNKELALEFNAVFDDMIEDIKTSIKYTDTPYDTARQIAVNFGLSVSLARALFNILQDKVIYKALS